MKTEEKPISRLLEFIDYLIEEKKVDSMADFERDCGLYYGSIANQKRGTGLLNGGLLYQIHKAFPDLNIDWVITRKSVNAPGFNRGMKALYFLLIFYVF